MVLSTGLGTLVGALLILLPTTIGQNWPPQPTGPMPNYFDWANGPDVPPNNPSPLNDEFNGTSLSGQWTVINGGTQTVANGYLDFNAPVNSPNDNIMSIVQTLPTAPWKFTSKLSINFVSVSGTGHIAGMVLRESATSKMIIMAVALQSGVCQVFVFSFTNNTTFNATIYTGPASLRNAYYFRIGQMGTTLTFEVSSDGVGFMQVYSESVTSHFTTAPNQVGLALDNVDANNPTDGIFWWFRRTT